MRRVWEHKVDNISGQQTGQIEEWLMDYGRQGWELVAVSNNRIYMKRPITQN